MDDDHSDAADHVQDREPENEELEDVESESEKVEDEFLEENDPDREHSQVVAPAKDLIDMCVEKGKAEFPDAALAFDALSSVAKIIKYLAKEKWIKIGEGAIKLMNTVQKVEFRKRCQKIKGYIKENFPELLGGSGSVDVAADIKDLSKKMQQLREIIYDNLADFKSFFVEHRFTTEIIINVNIHMRLICDVLERRDEKSIEAFLKNYALYDAHVLVLRVMGFLDNDVSNPLIASMNADMLRSREAIEVWKARIPNILDSLFIAYCFHEGLKDTPGEMDDLMNDADGQLDYFIKNRNPCGQIGQINDAISETKEKLEQFVENYEVDYWPECVEKFMRETADENEEYDNNCKADIIMDNLNKIYTKHKFVVVVYTVGEESDDHWFQGHDDNIIRQFRRADCNMVVYRYFEDYDEEQIELMKEQLEEKLETPIYISPDFGMQESADDFHETIEHCGFVAIIKQSRSDTAFRADGDGEGPALCEAAKCVYRASDMRFSVLRQDDEQDAVVVIAPQ